MAADVIVVGLGGIGASVAFQLALRGMRVIGLDRLAPPHNRGSHGGGPRVARTAQAGVDQYLPQVRRARQLWRDLEELAGPRLLTRTGALVLGRPERAEVTRTWTAAAACGVAHDLLDADEVRRRFPVLAPADDEAAVHEADAGVVRPDAAVAAWLTLAGRAGADLRTGVAVRDWSATTSAWDGVSVSTPAGVLHDDRLVLCPGPWAGELVRLDVPLRVRRRVVHYWEGSGLFAAERMPAWVWEDGDGTLTRGTPMMGRAGSGARAYASGPGSDGAVQVARLHGDEVTGPEEGLAPARPEEIAQMRIWLQSRLPSLGGWLGARPYPYVLSPDHQPLLGVHPAYPGVTVACGFADHAILAPVVGEIAADLVEHGKAGQPIDPFDLARFA